MSATPASVADAYSRTGVAWQLGPGRVYDRLADVVVAHAPIDLRGRRVLDLGAGTGAATRAITRAGGHVVAADVAMGMLVAQGRDRPPCAVADALALPLKAGAVDAVVAAFSLNHVTDPVRGLREAQRVTRPGGAIVASAYADDDAHPVKGAVETAAREMGWTVPPWYAAVRDDAVPKLATVDRAVAAIAAAGGRGDVRQERVEFPELGATQLIEWRMGMAQLAPFVAQLDERSRHALRARALALLGAAPPLIRSIIILTITVD